MNKWIINFIFLFCLPFCLVCSTEKELYLLNIEKALVACHFDEEFETLNNPNLREEVKELFLRIYENEKNHPGFIQCITAQDSLFYAYQVIAKELYRRLYGIPRDDFEFLRFPTQNLLKNREEFFLRYPSLILSKEELAKEFKTTPDYLDESFKEFERLNEEEYLRISRGEKETRSDEDDEEASSRFQINDTCTEISRELLSVNFTMETYRPLDSAMFVFLSGNSVSLDSLSNDGEEYKQKFMKILYELFDSLSIPREKLTACLEELIKKAPLSRFGIINQIFIPKENITDFMYLSFGGGFLHSIYDSKFETSYIEFQNNRQEGSFRTFRNFQARVIAGSLFENPQVKIFRYTLIPKETERQYEAIVRDSIDELLR
jgi:hypothetical protein